MRRGRVALLLGLPLGLALLAIAILAALSRPAPAPCPAEAARQAAPPAALPIRFAPAAPAPPPDGGPATFEGRVLCAATGAAIPGADLTFSRGGAADSVRADAEGGFLFRPPAAGRWQLAAVAAPGYFPFAPEWGFSPVQLEAAPGRRVRGLEVFLSPAEEITGLVVDEDGAPVPGAEVQLLGAGGRAALIPIPGHFTTGADGTFRAAAPLGSLLEARKAGYHPGHARVDVRELVNGRVRIVLGIASAGAEPARGSLAGRVLGRDGRPVPGALVELARTHGWAYGGAPVAQAVADADGRFRFTELDRSPHRLTARADGHVPGLVPRVLPDGPEVVLRLEAGGRLHGCVRDENGGGPVAPFTVSVYFSRNGFRSVPDLAVSVADPSGCFLLEELDPGPGVVVVQAPRRAPSAASRVEVPPPPGNAELEVSLGAGGSLAGVVQDERSGARLAHARVSAEDAAGRDFVPPTTVVGEATTGPDGAFALGGLPERVRVTVNAAGHHPATSGPVDVPPGGLAGPLVIALRPELEGDVGPVEPVGIGAVLVPTGAGLAIGALRAGTPAEGSGLVPGDEVLEIDGHAAGELGLGGAVEALRGAEGTSVFLRVRRGNGTLEIEIPRRRQR